MMAGVQLAQILNPLVDSRAYPIIVPEASSSTPPYIVYQIVSVVPEVTHDGITGHEWVHVQIDVYHKTLNKCTLLANKVINTINNQIKPSIYGGTQQLYDTASSLYRISIEYEFWQTTPTQ